MILLVEDNELIQDLVMEVCRSVGLAVYCAPRCRVALNALRHYRDIRMIIMDYRLAGPNSGIACASMIRTQFPEPICNIPIVGLTGGLYPGIDPELMPVARINEQLDKPFRVDELIAIIDRYVPPETRVSYDPEPPMDGQSK